MSDIDDLLKFESDRNKAIDLLKGLSKKDGAILIKIPESEDGPQEWTWQWQMVGNPRGRDLVYGLEAVKHYLLARNLDSEDDE